MTAIGQVRQLFALDVKLLLAKLLFVILGALHSLEAVAIAYCLATGVGSFLRFNLVRRHVDFKAAHFVELIKPTILPAVLSAAGPAMLVYFLETSYFVLIGSLGLAFFGWVIGVLMFDNPMADEIRRFIKKINNKRHL